ncbi:MAG: hypothetical protein J6N52_15100 [Clostridia bacterium]|nr:hypothetical protein [Clostridia bacterium]
MKLHRIADLYVGIDFKYPTMTAQTVKFLSDDRPEIVDIVVWASDESIQNTMKKYPNLTADNCEYLITGSGFYNSLIDFDGLMIHSSSVLYKGAAYLFSADPGTGKSTHTQLWKKAFGDEAEILNDDKPAVRIIDGTAYAYGTPWSGKTDLSINACAPVKGICFLERGTANEIKRVEPGEILKDILKQTIRPSDEQRMDKLLSNLDRLLRMVPVYRLKCNMELEAAHVSFEGMK